MGDSSVRELSGDRTAKLQLHNDHHFASSPNRYVL
jgi:hypothetical protein